MKLGRTIEQEEREREETLQMMCGPREIKRGNWVPDQIRSGSGGGGENNHSARGLDWSRTPPPPVAAASTAATARTAADWKGSFVGATVLQIAESGNLRGRNFLGREGGREGSSEVPTDSER